MSRTVGIIGAGSMGTALAQIVAKNTKVLLYARRYEIAEDINKNRVNSQYFPEIELNKNIFAVNTYEELKNVEIIFLCTPSSVIREIVTELKSIVNDNCIFVNTAKGIEDKTNKRMTEVIGELINTDVVAFSGPNIASEMVNYYPSSVSIACNNKVSVNKVKKVLESNTFKVNTLDDVIGTEFCGIIKNVIAISQGICQGIGINYNAKFTVFTKSFSEAKDIIEILGGNRNTVDDYCGFGDIITASTLSVSRNQTLGVLYGKGIIVDEKASGIVFEGKNTAKILKGMCDELNIDSLTVNFVYEVIINKKNPKIEFNKLWEKL